MSPRRLRSDYDGVGVLLQNSVEGGSEPPAPWRSLIPREWPPGTRGWDFEWAQLERRHLMCAVSCLWSLAA